MECSTRAAWNSIVWKAVQDRKRLADRAAIALGLLLAAAFCSILLAIPVAAETRAVQQNVLSDGYYKIVLKTSGKFMTIKDNVNANGTPVQIGGWTGIGQKYRVQAIGNNQYQIYPVLSSQNNSRVLDVYRGNDITRPVQPGMPIDIWDPVDIEAQVFTITKKADGYYTIAPSVCQGAVFTAKLPNSNGCAVTLEYYTELSTQHWDFVLLTEEERNPNLERQLNIRIGQRVTDLNRYIDKGLENPYYFSNKNIYYSKDEKYVGQCTWYVWGRAKEQMGINLNSYCDAKDFLLDDTPGVTIGYDTARPRKNTIAITKANEGFIYGHVRYIETVIGDLVYYSEANVPWDDRLDTQDGILKCAEASEFAKHCDAFLYLQPQ